MFRPTLPASPRIRSPAGGYAVAAGAVVGATLLRLALDPWMGDLAPYALLFGAVALVVWLAGAGPAALAALAGFAASDWLFIAPRGSLDLDSPQVLSAFLAYAVSCGVVILFGEGMHRASRRLRLRTEVLGLAMSAGAMGAWSRDLRRGGVWWSRELERIFGLPPGGFEGTEAGFLDLVHPEDRARVREAVEEAIARRGDYSVDFRYRRYNESEWRWMEGRGKVSCDASGEPLALHGVGIDVTQRRLEQQRLRESEEGLREADRRKNEFIAALSHELRNPLAPMRNALYILRMADGIPERARGLHEMLHRQVEQMARLVEDLLDISRISRGAIDLRIEPVALSQELRATVEASRAGLGVAQREIVLDLPDEELAILADRVRLQQVVENLVANAVKFSGPGGRIEVRVRAEGDDFVAIQVRDDGIGIAPEDLPRIWDLFVQVGDSPDRSRQGLGIGLALVKDMVARQGGTVTAQSGGRGRGAVFEVRLPRAHAVLPRAAAEGGRSPASRSL